MGAKILIADDEAYIRLLMEQTLEDLEDEGVQILCVDNGQDALRVIQEEKPGMVFLDVMMPRMDGFEVCRQAKQNLNGEIYVVLLTAKGQDFDRQRGSQSGADLYVTKPFDPDEIIALAKNRLRL